MCRQVLLPAGPRGACSTIAAAGRRACRSGLRFCFCPGAHMFPYRGAAGPPCGLKDARKGGRQMRQVVMDCIGTFGYWGVFALIAVENIFPPIPSEVILTFAGFCTAATALRVPGVVAAATLGSLAGALVLYGVGRLLQPQRLDALLAGPAGRALHMEKQVVEKAAAWFAKKGAASVFYCRCVPIVRSLISIPAGMAGMRLAPFFLYTTAGSTLWNILLVGLGAAAGQSWPRVAAAIASASNVLKWALGLAAVVLFAVLFIRRRAVDAKRRRTL